MPSSAHPSIPWPQLYLGVALTTLATLLLELSLTRIFSVVFYYHFAFLAISIALFGLGAGGVFSYVVAGWKTPLFRKLGHLSMLNSLLVIAALAVVVAQNDEPSAWDLALVYFTTALPFFVSGTIVSLAISETIERVDRVYFFDLLGAAAGCLLLVPLLNHFGGLSTVMLVAVLFAAAAAIWHSMAGSVKLRAAAVALALALFAFVFYNGKHHIIDIRYAKGQKLKKEEFVQWNSFSRIAVRDYSIFIDADASTGIASFDFAHLTARERHDLLEQGPALPYAVRPGAQDADHRARRRLGCGARAGLRQPRYHRRRNQPHHRHHHHARALRGPEPAASTCGPTCTSSWKMAAASCAAATSNTR